MRKNKSPQTSKIRTVLFESTRSFEWPFSCVNTSSFKCAAMLLLSSMAESLLRFTLILCTSSFRLVPINMMNEKEEQEKCS